AEGALSRDVPVAHVAQPVVHPLPVLRRRPLDLLIGVQERLPELVAADEPVVHDAEDERRLAAPADGVAVDDRARLDQEAALAQGRDDRLCRLVRALAFERAVPGQEAARLVDRREHRQVVEARELEVLRARTGRALAVPGASVVRAAVPGYRAVACG